MTFIKKVTIERKENYTRFNIILTEIAPHLFLVEEIRKFQYFQNISGTAENNVILKNALQRTYKNLFLYII